MQEINYLLHITSEKIINMKYAYNFKYSLYLFYDKKLFKILMNFIILNNSIIVVKINDKISLKLEYMI